MQFKSGINTIEYKEAIVVKEGAMYNKCECKNCGSQFATVISNEADIEKEKCPHCGEKQLKISGKLSVSEFASQFSGG